MAHLETLGESLYELLSDQVLTDVTFLIGTEKFKAHRIVLCAASPYFRQLLTGEFMENKNNHVHDGKGQKADDNIITLNDFGGGPETFNTILEFLYRGKVTTLTCSNACTLLRIADQLCIRQLVLYVSKFLLDGHIDKDNVRDLLLLTDQVSSLESLLSVSCVQYMVANFSELLGADPYLFDGFKMKHVYGIVAKVFPLCLDSDRVCQLWNAVSSCYKAKNILEETPSAIYKCLMLRRWSSYDVFGAVGTNIGFDFLVTGIPIKKYWRSDKFEAGGSTWNIHVKRQDDYYGAFLYLVLDNKTRAAWDIASFATFSICAVDRKNENRRHQCIPVSAHVFHRPAMSWGRDQMVCIALLEDPQSGFMQQGELLFRVEVKVDPILKLCVAVSVLKFNLSDALGMFNKELLSDVLLPILSSDSLYIESEEELISIITKSDMDENVREKLYTAIRLHDVPFSRLLSLVQSTPQLQQSTTFKDLLKKMIKGAIVPSSPAAPPTPPRGWRTQSVPPGDTVCVEALVEWLTTTTRSEEPSSKRIKHGEQCLHTTI